MTASSFPAKVCLPAPLLLPGHGKTSGRTVFPNIETPPTGGWDPRKHDVEASLVNSTAFPTSIAEEIDQAFANVDYVLKYAGAKGWSQVYKVLTLSTSIPEQHEHIVRNLKKWMPDHRATWTEAGISYLGGGPAMRFEIEVEAVSLLGIDTADDV